MYPAEIIAEAFKKAGSVYALAQRADVSDQTVRNWLNLSCAPTHTNLTLLLSIAKGEPFQLEARSWEQRQLDIEAKTRSKAQTIERSHNETPKPTAKKAWPQLVEITRIHENADFAFGVTEDALITFIVPHVADKLKEANYQNGDEVTLIVRQNDHPNADLYAFKWLGDEDDGY